MWYKYTDTLQKTVNYTVLRSTRKTPFKLLAEAHTNIEIKRILEVLEERRITSTMNHFGTISKAVEKKHF